ncbi:hypothetical protein OU787_08935 [Kitasatospora sp. YST-16]|uniref:DUF6879 family protein n=1 Tax=Kitasatospora sp. YST-16 TaxID=2998080 RepID=UPI0022852FC0|nr:DUF6879 family protein [Kitasatospora sp. YST-16]WAL71620.1 hypothetical protein OU787_08935 [Kitasatospora sp. YST-16]WNW37658.1 hypothetical protein RKE32_08885 [Streptomyces sp. Li-HN-5-13]
MSRRLRYIGSNSGHSGCPMLYEDEESGSVVIGYDEFESMFTTFQHTAFRLETRHQYGSDAQTETYRRFVAGEDLGWDSDDDWSRNRREQSARGKRFERVRVMDSPPTTGQRYLLANAAEIGTGTGWNAALLAHRLGSANVTTVEVDAATAAARHRLTRAGYAPVTVVGDGERGHPPGAPFDRVLATCSVRRVPYARVEQCWPGSRGCLSAPWPADGAASTTSLSPEELGGWVAMFALGVQLPGVFPLVERYPDGSYTLWLHDTAVTSWATADWEPGRTEFAVVQSGPRRLWDEAERAWRWWDANGRPGVERFGLTVGPERCAVWLDAPDRPVPQAG